MVNTIRLAAVLLLLSVISATVFAQARTEVGFKGGVNRTDIVGDDTSDLSHKSGAALGAFVSLKLNRFLALQPEMLYAQKGANADAYSTGFLGESVQTSLRFHYLEFPVILKFVIPMSGNLNPAVYAGPALNVKLRATAHQELLGNSMDQKIGNIKSTDYSLVMGFGGDFQWHSTRVVLDFRLTVGLGRFTTVVDNVGIQDDVYLIDEEGNPLNWRHTGFRAMAGVAF
jgi:hypothetical protein